MMKPACGSTIKWGHVNGPHHTHPFVFLTLTTLFLFHSNSPQLNCYLHFTTTSYSFTFFSSHNYQLLTNLVFTHLEFKQFIFEFQFQFYDLLILIICLFLPFSSYVMFFIFSQVEKKGKNSLFSGGRMDL